MSDPGALVGYPLVYGFWWLLSLKSSIGYNQGRVLAMLTLETLESIGLYFVDRLKNSCIFCEHEEHSQC